MHVFHSLNILHIAFLEHKSVYIGRSPTPPSLSLVHAYMQAGRRTRPWVELAWRNTRRRRVSQNARARSRSHYALERYYHNAVRLITHAVVLCRRQRGWSLIEEDTPAPAGRRPSARSVQSRTLSATSEESDAPQYQQRGLVENSAGALRGGLKRRATHGVDGAASLCTSFCCCAQ